MSSAQASVPSSRSLFKNILQGSGLYAAALLGQRLVSVILLPITTRFLTPADYGVADLLEQAGGLLGLLLGANFSSALGYFYFETDATQRRQAVVSTTVMGAGVIGVAAMALCWPFAGTLSRLVFGKQPAVHYLHIVFLSIPLSFMLEALFSWLRVEDRPGIYLAGSILRIAAAAGSIVLLVAAFRLGVVGMLYSSLIAMALPGCILGFYCFRRTPPAFEPRLFFRIAAFTAPLGLSGIAMSIMHFGDRFFLPHYRSFAELGVYTLAYKIGMLISVIYASFHVYWSAQAFQIMQREDAEAVFARICTYVVLGVSFCGLGIIVCSKPVIRLLVAPAYHGAAALIPLIVVAYAIRNVGEVFRRLFLVAGRPGYDAVCTWFGTVVCLAGYAILIPRFGVWGAATATAVTFVLFTALSLGWTYRLRPYRLEATRLAKIGMTIAATGIPYALLPVSSLAGQIAWAALLLAAFPLVLWLLRFPSAGEREVLRASLKLLRGSLPNPMAWGNPQ